MRGSSKNFWVHTLVLIVLLISGMIDALALVNSPFGGLIERLFVNPSIQGMMHRISWSLLQIFPALIFGFFSDLYQRKLVLVASQIFGVLGLFFLWLGGVTFWVFLFLGFFFNPFSIVRATLLDDFSKVSALKVIAITYIVKNISWVGLELSKYYTTQALLNVLLPTLVLTLILSVALLSARNSKVNSKSLINKNKTPILLTITALSLAETTFYLLWVYLESGRAPTGPTLQGGENWLSVITVGTLLGTAFVMFYKKIPHFSIITILYGAGFGMLIVTFIFMYKFSWSYTEDTLTTTMSHYSVIGGIYLPFVADSLITLCGVKRKAVGSALSEVADALALIVASSLAIFLAQNVFHILIVIGVLYFMATIFQKAVESNEDIKLL